MPRDPSQHSPSNRLVPRQGDRRQVNIPRRVPLMGGLGLVFSDRRSYRERRRNPNGPVLFQSQPCALLQYREPPPSRGLLGQVSVWTRSALGGWIRRLK